MSVHNPVFAIIGATGFIGRALVDRCNRDRIPSRLFSRSPYQDKRHSCSAFNGHPSVLRGATTVIFLANKSARSNSDASTAQFNVDLALQAAHAAIEAGVKKFVFVSSLHVYGRSADHPVRPDDAPHPDTSYGDGKLRAENALALWAHNKPIDLVIVRPPLVFGANAKGNFKKLLWAARKGLPLPLGRADAPRSVIGIDNLVDALIFASLTKMPENAIFMPADSRDVTTRDLYVELCGDLGKKPMLLAIPKIAVRMLATLIGKKEIYEGLFTPMTINRAHWDQLGWIPPLTLSKGLAQAIQ